MSDLTWEWTLGASDTIIARVDAKSLVESVYVGQRLVSRSGAGGKPEGHTVTLPAARGDDAYRASAPQELRLTYDPAFSQFELRANGQLVQPARAPGTPLGEVPPGRVYGHMPLPAYAPQYAPPQESSGVARVAKALVLLLAVAVGAIVAISGVRRYIAGARASAEGPGGSIVASTQLLTATYPPGFKASQETKTSLAQGGRDDACPMRGCTIEFSLVKIQHTSRDEGLFLASFKMNGLGIGRDAWRVSNLLHEKFDELAKLRGSDYQEVDRQDGTCLGEPGAVVTGRFRHNGEDGTMWSCTFIRDGNAFWFTTFLNTKYAADDPELRKIVDATTLAPAR
jgi:hypothetical protein